MQCVSGHWVIKKKAQICTGKGKTVLNLPAVFLPVQYLLKTSKARPPSFLHQEAFVMIKKTHLSMSKESILEFSWKVCTDSRYQAEVKMNSSWGLNFSLLRGLKGIREQKARGG